MACRGGGGAGGGPWPPGASLGGGAGPACIGANSKRWGEFQPSKSSINAMGPALPMH